MQSSLAFAARRARAVAVALAAGLPLAVLAQPQDELASSWSLGAGAASTQQAYRGMGREARLLPFIRYDSRFVRFSGLGGEVKLPGLRLGDTQRLDFSLVGRLDLSGYDAGDSPFLAGMDERKWGFWAGAQAEWTHRLATVTAAWTADVSGHSDGHQFSLGLKRTWRIGQQLLLTPSLVATRHDSKYADYYYGVRATEARPGRAAYQGEAGTNVGVGLQAVYLIDPQHSVLLGLGATRLASGIRDSPLVDRSGENRVFVGYAYRFR